MPAVLRFGGLFCLGSVACWTAPVQQATPVVAQLDTDARDVTGSYWCSIDEDGYEYPRYPCVIKKVDERLVFAKLGGTQRIRGRITLDNRDGFSFVGEMYCPEDECQQALHGTFRPVGRGGFKGRFREETLVVNVTPAAANAFGGADYGGENGIFDLDGSVDGDQDGYRNYRIDSRGRRRP
ncbi:MAG: hypothetical protein H0U13_13335 [Gemmatimonadaceae bacterium]|nr:hypothetical protein [Gemmatimonadaceae bacterium]